MLRCDADIGEQRELHAPTDCRSVDGRDDRHSQASAAIAAGVGGAASVRRLRRLTFRIRHDFAHIVAGAKRRVSARHDDATNVRSLDAARNAASNSS